MGTCIKTYQYITGAINKWEGNIEADAAKHIGRIEYAIPRDVESVNLILELESEEATAYNQYTYTK